MAKQLLSLAAAAVLTGFVGAANASDLPPALGSASGQVLDAATMSNIIGTSASATLDFTASASGPTSAIVRGTGVRVTATTVGGLTPSNTATIAGTFTATSN